MRRGEVYLVRKPNVNDPKRQRALVIVSRQTLIDSRFASVTCAGIYSKHDGIDSQVAVGIDEGLKAESSIHCDDLMSVPKSLLTNYLGVLGPSKVRQLNDALCVALALDEY